MSRSLAERVRPWAVNGKFKTLTDMADDTTLGVLITYFLDTPLTDPGVFYSHLDDLGLVAGDGSGQYLDDVAVLSYGWRRYRWTTVSLYKPAFGAVEDPTRFLSLHCRLFPETSWCPAQIQV